jgi:serine/threonine protein phosphatase PrpC
MLKIERVEDVRPAVLDAIEAAGAAIRTTVPGALATIAAVIVDGTTARSITVGDSICAVIGGRGKLKYRSVAHGPTGFAEEAGLLEESEAMKHEERHLVSNMLGLEGMRIELGVPLDLAVRDTVLVASDALFDNVRFEEIAGLARVGPLVRAVDALAALARERMTGNSQHPHPDDLTIVAFRRTPQGSTKR